ncbi:MAG: phosphate butyryltransferase [Firmicutes bacterium]|nr:phosphate butyryltransferase [Bacillota bacterium]
MQSFREILQTARSRGPKGIAVAAAADPEVLLALKAAKAEGLVEPILIGDEREIRQIAEQVGYPLENDRLITTRDKISAARAAVQEVASGRAELLMKGLINTADLLRAVLDKEAGLRTGRLLSHVSVVEPAGYDRLMLITDGGINIAPTLEEKMGIIINAVGVAQALGITRPKVAALAALEQVNPRMPAAVDAAALSQMARRGQIPGAIVDGPLALDNAIDKESAVHKGIESPVAGEADILLAPNIEAGNILHKALVYFANVKAAGLVVGARSPIVVTSRAENHETKLHSIALATLVATR